MKHCVSRCAIWTVVPGFFLLLVGCAGTGRMAPVPASIEFSPSMIFPADQSLSRAEDGVLLGDGRLIVSDKETGLREVFADGTSVPFGSMQRAGYRHDPPSHDALANGVNLEPDGKHLLVADVLGGGIYRVRLSDGATTKIFHHAFGVNTAHRDSTGALWFTQSTACTAKSGEGRLFAAVDAPMEDGSLWRVGSRDGRLRATATCVARGLRFANGFELDEAHGKIYLAETCGDRILQASLDVETGAVGAWSTLASIQTPDNLKLDGRGLLWVASPIRSEVGVVDLRSGAYTSVLHVQTAEQTAISDAFGERGEQGLPRVELLSPALWAPLPGMVTGVILSPDGDLVCVTGLGNGLIRPSR